MTRRPPHVSGAHESAGDRVVEQGRASMDRRLLKTLTSVRRLIYVLAGSGVLIGLLIIAQAEILAVIVSRVYLQHAVLSQLHQDLMLFLGIILARVLITGLSENWSLNLATEAQVTLRRRLLTQIFRTGPMALATENSGSLVTTAIQGIDDLELFLARYFPQVLMTAIVPTLVFIRVMSRDWVSGLLLLITFPLIPLFMILIGRYTDGKTARQFDALSRLNGHFLDLLQGMETLKLFGRSQAQAKGVEETSERFREATMATLRIAFLSGMVLELLASLSMAMIAVAIGLRLIGGTLRFETGFMILILVPEFYMPWRALGAKFHDSLKGLTASKQIFSILDAPQWAKGTGSIKLPDNGPWSIELDHLVFTYPGRTSPALAGVSAKVMAGEHLALVGPSGSGKSTILALLLGLGPYAGSIRVDGIELSALDMQWWRNQMTWVGQRPYLFDATVRENLLAARANASHDDLRRALRQADALDFIDDLSQGLDTPLGQEGVRLSAGQRQRLALARAFLRNTPVLIFDEPSQNLDLAGEDLLSQAMVRLIEGRTAITIAHRLSTVTQADRVIVLEQGLVVQNGTVSDLAQQPGIFQQFVRDYPGGQAYADPTLPQIL